MNSRRWPRRSKRPRRNSNPPIATGSRLVPVRRKVPPSSALMPRPRMKMRLGLSIVRSSRALKAVPPPARACASRRARRTRTFSGAPTWRVPGSGCKVVGSRSGTEMSSVARVTRPEIRGEAASAPLSVRSRSAVAVASVLSASRALRPVTAISPGKFVAGSSRTWPLAARLPSAGVAALKLSMRSTSPSATSRALIAERSSPNSSSVNRASETVALPSIRGAVLMPRMVAETAAEPVRRRPCGARTTFAALRSRVPSARRSNSPTGSRGALPVRRSVAVGASIVASTPARPSASVPEARMSREGIPPSRNCGTERLVRSSR